MEYETPADLQARINVLLLYREDTYTYLKECPTIIVGFNATVPQFLKLPCIYGGIKDIGSYAKATTEQSFDLTSVSRATIRVISDLGAITKGIYIESVVNLLGYAKQTYIQTLDLSSYLKDNIEQPLDLRTLLKGWAYKVPVDLRNVIKIWFYENEVDLPVYIKQTYEQSLDLPSYLKDNIEQYLNLGNSLHGWQEEVLYGYIFTFESKDLPSSIASIRLANLGAYLNTVESINITSSLHGWDTLNLLKSITGVYGPYDIQSSLYAIDARNLSAYIKGFKGIKIPFNLQGIVSSYYYQDLLSNISSTNSVDLLSYLTATGGYADVGSAAYPKVISVRSYIPISLLDHKDLLGFINQGCFGSAFKNLYSSVIAQHARDLRGTAFPVREGTIVDLTSYINAANYLVQDVITITLSKTTSKLVNVPVRFSFKAPILTYDTINITTGQHSYKQLSSYIKGMHFTADLSGTLTCAADTSYYVDNVRPISHPGSTNQVVLHLTGGREDWRREVEIMFRSTAKEYFYLSRANKVVKYEDDTRWSMIITGFDRVIDGDIDRDKVRSHYLTDLRKYVTIDAAIRDLIDRVTMYRQTDLAGNIIATGGFKDIYSRINYTGYVGTLSGFKTLSNSIYGYASAYSDMSGSIQSV